VGDSGKHTSLFLQTQIVPTKTSQAKHQSDKTTFASWTVSL